MDQSSTGLERSQRRAQPAETASESVDAEGHSQWPRPNPDQNEAARDGFPGDKIIPCCAPKK